MSLHRMLLQVALALLVAIVTAVAVQHSECQGKGQIALVVDGISGSSKGIEFYKSIGADPAIFMLSLDCLTNSRVTNLVKQDTTHEFGYRLDPKKDAKIDQLSMEDVKSELEGAKRRFSKKLGRSLKYVLFPYSTEETSEKLATAAEELNMVAVGYNMYLQTDPRKAKKELEKKINKPDEQSYIALIDGHADHVGTMGFLKERVANKQFKMVSLSQCIGLQSSPTLRDPTPGHYSPYQEKGGRTGHHHKRPHHWHVPHAHKQDPHHHKKVAIDKAEVEGFTYEVENERHPKKHHHKHQSDRERNGGLKGGHHQKKHMLAIPDGEIDGKHGRHHHAGRNAHDEQGKHHGSKHHGSKHHNRHNKDDFLFESANKMFARNAPGNAKDPDALVGKGSANKPADKKPDAQKGQAKKAGNAASPSHAALSFSTLTVMLAMTICLLI